ncbi:MAG: hypothetical protein LBF16_08265 [Pseudomonadales bacterium]|jgi:uncharacterized membrane-anchored protein|nr:hypothetical protein [Pseudomonadales bacterium]
MLEAIAAIIEAIVTAFMALIEAIASLFVAGGETLGVGEILALLVAVLAELVWWLVLVLIQLLSALFTWRWPRKVARPRFWRPKRKESPQKEDE